MRGDGTITIGAKIDTKEFDKQIDYIESRMEEIEYLLKQADLGFEVGDTQKLESEYEKLSNRLIDLRRRKQEVKEEPLDDGVSNSNFEKGIEKITKKITRMGLAMIGIRSLYGMISSSVSRITEENPQLQAQIDAIKTAIDNIVARLVDLLLPVIEYIVGLIGKLLKALFGIDIFAQSFNKNMKSANSSVTKMRKQLLGFDELNILNKDTGTTGALGGATVNVNAPTDANLGNIKTKIQDWFDKNGINIKIKYVEDAMQNPQEYIQGAKDIIQESVEEGGGVGGGIVELFLGKDNIITKIVKGINAASSGIPLWNWLFGKGKTGTIKDLKEILKSTTGMTGEMAKKIKNEFSDISVAYKNGMVEVTTKTGQVVSMTETEYKELMDALGNNTDRAFDTIQTGVKATQNAFTTTANETKKSWFSTFNDLINKYPQVAQAILDGNYTIKKDYVEVKTQSGEVVRYSIDEFKKLQRQLTDVGNEGVNSSNKNKSGWLLSASDIIAKYTGNDKNGVVGAITGAFNQLPNSAETNTKSIFNTITNLINKYNPPTKTVKVKADTVDFQNAIANAVTGGLSIVKTNVQIRYVGGIMGAKGLMFNPPKLARGGIINRPGRGINYRGATIGERGREAVVPLTDSQQMSLLGQEIAKNVVINLTNVTELDGKQIARSITQVMNDMNFASNGVI